MRKFMRKMIQVAGIVFLAMGCVLLLTVGARRFWFSATPGKVNSADSFTQSTAGSPCGKYADCLDRQRAAEAATFQSLSAELQAKGQRIDLTRSPAPDTESGSYAEEPGTSGHRSGH